MWSFLNSEWFGALMVGLVSAIGNKLWNRASARTKQRIEAAMGEITSIIHTVVITAAPTTSIADLITRCQGATSYTLKRLGLKPDPLINGLVNQAIAIGVRSFMDAHPDPKSITAPILTKLLPKSGSSA